MEAGGSGSGKKQCQLGPNTQPLPPTSDDFPSDCTWASQILLIEGVKVLEIAVGAVLALTMFSLLRISFPNLVADGQSLVRNSGVGEWGSKSDPQFSFTCH